MKSVHETNEIQRGKNISIAISGFADVIPSRAPLTRAVPTHAKVYCINIAVIQTTSSVAQGKLSMMCWATCTLPTPSFSEYTRHSYATPAVSVTTAGPTATFECVPVLLSR